MTSSPPLPVKPAAPTLRSSFAHAVRGALIGIVELVPGVSGGTVALVLGIFDRLITSANHLIRGVVRLVFKRGGKGFAHHLGDVEWSLVIPLLIGMFFALFALSGPLHGFVEGQPVLSNALFLGMVSASLLVPISMARDAGPITRNTRIFGPVVVLLVAAAVFWLLGIPSMQVEDPAWWVLILSGAAAVCALALPGLSGSFILLTFGMYEPTLEAVSERDFGYLALFASGAVLGLASIVQLLAYLLRVHRRAVLLVATGLILGSLRALWPWQDNGTLLQPDGDWLGPLLAALGGATVVLLLWLRERRGTAVAASL
ncbi:DUF368 domain-containing protein [Arthrobacter sp. Bz4]|uniref:DUF368 domain-containing protein n=1 Tax=Arthrobacter sp. Bz4 TaxID=2171979 RepID=UPI001FB02CAC|nr:DUF368 domain-containing protein [Arthrobacter sp. Bz4]